MRDRDARRHENRNIERDIENRGIEKDIKNRRIEREKRDIERDIENRNIERDIKSRDIERDIENRHFFYIPVFYVSLTLCSFFCVYMHLDPSLYSCLRFALSPHILSFSFSLPLPPPSLSCPAL